MQSTPFLGGSGGMPPQENFEKISAIKLNLEAILANNFMLLSILYNSCDIKGLNLRIFYIVSDQFTEIN